MEQISKNEVIELIKKYKEMAVPRWDEWFTDAYSGLALLSGLLKDIEQMETVENRLKAKWIKERYCSHCEWDKNDFEYIGGWRENFCPNCGARMRGEE